MALNIHDSTTTPPIALDIHNTVSSISDGTPVTTVVTSQLSLRCFYCFPAPPYPPHCNIRRHPRPARHPGRRRWKKAALEVVVRILAAAAAVVVATATAIPHVVHVQIAP